MKPRAFLLVCLASALIWAALIAGIAHASPSRQQVAHAVDPAFRATPHVALAALALAAVVALAWKLHAPAWADWTGAAIFAGLAVHNASIRCAR